MDQLTEIKAYFQANPPEDKELEILESIPLSAQEKIRNPKRFVDGHIAFIEKNYDPDHPKKKLTWEPYMNRLVRYYQMCKLRENETKAN